MVPVETAGGRRARTWVRLTSAEVRQRAEMALEMGGRYGVQT